jgi:hypothetical protein
MLASAARYDAGLLRQSHLVPGRLSEKAGPATTPWLILFSSDGEAAFGLNRARKKTKKSSGQTHLFSFE